MKIILLSILLTINAFCFSQNKSSLSMRDILQSNEWIGSKTHDGTVHQTILKFTEDKMLTTVIFDGETHEYHFFYRLSDNPDTNLRISKRPITNNGKYLLCAIDGEVKVWKIISINNNVLELIPPGSDSIYRMTAKPL